MSELNDLITRFSEAKAELKDANDRAKVLKKLHDELESQLLEYLKENELDRVSAAGHTASYSTETVASVDDWEAFFGYVKQHDAFYLLQKRIASAAYREVLQVDGVVPPGTSPMERDKLSFRKA
ncbi:MULTISPECIES: hypothetical protein [unclassified Cobetia]|uniref:gp33 family protein n=1 Tax=Pseudomonadota TaxID=1224 RepID=UPI0024490FB7|nr:MULTISPECIES: hypothetical protein [unclassified Cobetia]MDH2290029.1 hypothetical protein [Cobetia sp. 10Alg 146]MDH2296070.1 hypothetical protein [Cobetia sp. 1AS1]